MTFNTTYVVISWSKSVIDGFAFREDEFVVFEAPVAAGSWRFRLRNALVDWRPKVAETIEEVVWGFCIHVSGERFRSTLTFDGRRRPHWQRERESEQEYR